MKNNILFTAVLSANICLWTQTTLASNCEQFLGKKASLVTVQTILPMGYIKSILNPAGGRGTSDGIDVIVYYKNGSIKVFGSDTNSVSHGRPAQEQKFSSIKFNSSDERIIGNYIGHQMGGGRSTLLTVTTLNNKNEILVYKADSHSMNKQEISTVQTFSKVEIGKGESVIGSFYGPGMGGGRSDLVTITTLDSKGQVRVYSADSHSMNRKNVSKGQLFSKVEISKDETMIGSFYGRGLGGGRSDLLTIMTLDIVGQIRVYDVDSHSMNRQDISTGRKFSKILLGTGQAIIEVAYSPRHGGGQSDLVTVTTIDGAGLVRIYEAYSGSYFAESETKGLDLFFVPL